MKKGFGIIEVLIASAIISTVLGGLVYVGKLALSTSVYMQERSSAIGLAIEGIEVIRGIRDTNWIDGANNTTWKTLILDGAGNPMELVPDSSKNYRIVFHKLEGNQGRYGLTLGSSEKIILGDGGTFFREIIIEPAGDLIKSDTNLITDEVRASNSFKVTCNITWDNNKKVGISELLTNWRPDY